MAYWFINTPGIGSIVVFTVAILVFIAYFRMLRWIQTTPPDPAPKTDDDPHTPSPAAQSKTSNSDVNQ